MDEIGKDEVLIFLKNWLMMEMQIEQMQLRKLS